MYKYNFIKLSWGGSIFSDADIWANGIHLGFTDKDIGFEVTSIEGQEWLGNVATLVQDWFVSPGAAISSRALLSWVKFANIGQDGKYIQDPWIRDIDPGVAGGSTNVTAPQLSVALSYQSNKIRGVAKDGRIYPPLTGVAGTNGRDQGYTESRSKAFSKLLSDINAVAGFNDSVAPKVILVSNKGLGEVNYATKVRVGDVIDTQRRRRNKMKENYNVKPITL